LAKCQKEYKKLKINFNNVANVRKNQSNNLNRSLECIYDNPEEIIINEKDKSKAIKRQNSMEEVSYQKEKKPIKLYSKPTLIGLNNIGATCFMNSTLQCLSQTEDFTNYFLSNKNENRILINNIAKLNVNAPQLSPIYLNLIKQLWSKKDIKPFSPNIFMNLFGEKDFGPFLSHNF
jgi:ubiquitin carboxyl-terminal hydrolase 4/11/15